MWEDKSTHDLDCTTDDNFCQTSMTCEEAAKKLKPVGFQISGTVFELKPEMYLNQADGRCQFAINENKMKGSSSDMFIIGDLMLRHLYQVYDFEKDQIGLGINVHS